MKDRFRPQMIQSGLFAPNTLGRCDFFTATDCLTAMAVARTKSHLFRLLTFLWVGVHGPRPMESKRNRFRSRKFGVGINRFWLNGIGIGIDSTWPCSARIGIGISSSFFQSGIGIDSGQLESSTRLLGTTFLGLCLVLDRFRDLIEDG